MANIPEPKHKQDTVARASPRPATTTPARSDSRGLKNSWSDEEHNRFLHGLEIYPRGPWKCIASIVGTKTTRQTMSHAQKYREKMERSVKAARETLASQAIVPDTTRTAPLDELLPNVPVLQRPTQYFPGLRVAPGASSERTDDGLS